MLDFTNFRDHPSERSLEVFHFFEQDQADCFEQIMAEHEVWYERSLEIDEEREVYLFCTKRSQSKLAHRCNHLTNAKFRKPFIPDAGFRYLVVIITILAIITAIVGYVATR